MGRDEHRQRKNNKSKLPQTPSNQKDATGIDIDMSVNPRVQFGINEEEEKRGRK